MLYHYTSPKVIMNIIREEGVCLRFSRYDCLNDTSEGKEAVAIQQEVCGQLRQEYADSRHKLELLDEIEVLRPDFKSIFVESGDRLQAESVEHDSFTFTQGDTGADKPSARADICMIPAVPYICSFSQEPDALTMWNYYTKGTHYEGYNVGLEVEGLCLQVYGPENDEGKTACSAGCDTGRDDICGCEVHGKPELKCEWWSIIYDKTHQHDKIRTEIERILHQGHFSKAEYVAQLNNWAIRFKNEIFRHEKEERLICYVPEEELRGGVTLDDYIQFRVVNGCLVPYLDVLIADKSALKEITIGPLIEEKLAKNTMELFLRLKGYDEVDIHTSKAPIRY